MSKEPLNPGTKEAVLKCLDSSHTDVHRSIDALKKGGTAHAKALIVKQINALTTALSLL